jgi:CRP-like cAMP-binding protein
MSLINMLRENTVFKVMPEEALAHLVTQLESRTIHAGKVLFNLGDPGAEMLLVQSGKIAIYTPESGRPEVGQPIRIFSPGDSLGEMALIDGMPRSTSARAETETQVLALSKQAFQELLGEFPDASAALLREFSSRIRYTTDFIGEMRTWVQRMAEGNYEAIRADSDIQESSLAALAAEFVRMAAQVREREDRLRREVAQLRIEIDEKKRDQEVKQITESDYYRDLKEKLRLMREQDDE